VEQEFSDAAALRTLTAHFGASGARTQGAGLTGQVS